MRRATAMTEGAEICSAEPGLRWWIKVKYPEVVEVRSRGQEVDDSKRSVHKIVNSSLYGKFGIGKDVP
jgi:hypothetical protein